MRTRWFKTVTRRIQCSKSKTKTTLKTRWARSRVWRSGSSSFTRGRRSWPRRSSSCWIIGFTFNTMRTKLNRGGSVTPSTIVIAINRPWSISRITMTWPSQRRSRKQYKTRHRKRMAIYQAKNRRCINDRLPVTGIRIHTTVIPIIKIIIIQLTIPARIKYRNSSRQAR